MRASRSRSSRRSSCSLAASVRTANRSVTQPDFVKFAQALRSVGMEEYNAAKSKKVDTVNDLSDKLTDACANCHDKYRPDSRIGGKKLGVDQRCTPVAW